jgi:hypothetical protein
MERQTEKESLFGFVYGVSGPGRAYCILCSVFIAEIFSFELSVLETLGYYYMFAQTKNIWSS